MPVETITKKLSEGHPNVVELEQDGWTLEYDEYQAVGGLQLPRKFEVANDEVTIKVVVDTWSDLPAATVARK